MEDFSFATVPFDQANKVVRALNARAQGRPIAEIAKEASSEGARAKAPGKGRKKQPAADSWRDEAAPGKKKKSKAAAVVKDRCVPFSLAKRKLLFWVFRV